MAEADGNGYSRRDHIPIFRWLKPTEMDMSALADIKLASPTKTKSIPVGFSQRTSTNERIIQVQQDIQVNPTRVILLTPDQHTDYQLIDTGGFEKLERFGPYILTRPEPQAIWDKSLPESEWEERSNAVFKKDKNSQEKGQWVTKGDMPEKWVFQYRTKSLHLRSKLALSSFKHVGVFPEQATNWDYISKKLKQIPEEKPNVLNLFAYTGIASLAAKAAGADVTHVDSVKQVISWSRENMQLSGLDNIRWVVEDAMKFVQREVRRGNQYNGIILDPPAYGRGPDGEKWLLEESLNEILRLSALLLKKENFFFIINLYSLGFSALIVENLIKAHFGTEIKHEFGELFIPDSFGKKLPLGVFSRFSDQND